MAMAVARVAQMASIVVASAPLQVRRMIRRLQQASQIKKMAEVAISRPRRKRRTVEARKGRPIVSMKHKRKKATIPKFSERQRKPKLTTMWQGEEITAVEAAAEEVVEVAVAVAPAVAASLTAVVAEAAVNRTREEARNKAISGEDPRLVIAASEEALREVVETGNEAEDLTGLRAVATGNEALEEDPVEETAEDDPRAAGEEVEGNAYAAT
jgi:hypothetical protein